MVSVLPICLSIFPSVRLSVCLPASVYCRTNIFSSLVSASLLKEAATLSQKRASEGSECAGFVARTSTTQGLSARVSTEEYTQSNIQPCTDTHTHSQTHSLVQTHIHTHSQTHSLVQTHIHTHSPTHSHVQTHTHCKSRLHFTHTYFAHTQSPVSFCKEELDNIDTCTQPLSAPNTDGKAGFSSRLSSLGTPVSDQVMSQSDWRVRQRKQH